MTKLNKIVMDVKVEKKVDNRVNNTGRPVNKKSNRQQRLAKQQHYANVNDMFVSGNEFKVNNSTYKYDGKSCILNNVTGYVCNVDYIGRTKVTGYTFVLGKKVNVELNLKTLQFVK
jgi:hypothetical protein